MGRFTDWVNNGLHAVRDGVTDSVVYVFSKLKHSYSDDDVDKVVATADAAIVEIEKILAAAIDNIPGVPTVIASIGAQAAGSILQAAIAGATQAAKEFNNEG